MISSQNRRIKLLELYANYNLSDAFFIKLKEIAVKHGMDPADLLLVMYSESGVNPNAMNSDGGAVGIGQFMPFVLKNLGFQGTSKDFSKLSAEQQLDYMEKMINLNIKTNGGQPFENATRYYQSHFLPATLSRGSSLDTIIADGRPGMQKATWEKAAYDHNTAFDTAKKGYITVGDLHDRLEHVKKDSKFQEILSRLNSTSSNSITQPTTDEDYSEINNSNLFENKLNEASESLEALGNHNFLIYIKANDFCSSLEFARILSSALNEEIQVKTSIHSDNKNIEISCQAQGSKNSVIDAVEEISKSVSKKFNQATKKIGSISPDFFINYGERSSLNYLNYKVAMDNYDIFMNKFRK